MVEKLALTATLVAVMVTGAATLAAPSAAHAQELTWHTKKVRVVGVPVGVSLRNWGPTGDTFLFVHHVDRDDETDDLVHTTTLRHLRCDDAPEGWCATSTFLDSERVGDTVITRADRFHYMHPTTSVKLGGEAPKLILARAEPRHPLDCLPLADEPSWTLSAFLYQSGEAAVTDSMPLVGTDDCRDHGKTEVLWSGDDLHACYTSQPRLGDDVVQCNDDIGTDWALDDGWQAPVDLDLGDGLEDHPSFVMRDGVPVVALHVKQGDDHSIRMRLASGEWVTLSQVDPVWKNHPHMSDDGGAHVLVYQVGLGASARIAYKRCHPDQAPGGCLDYRQSPDDDWKESYVTDAPGGEHHFPGAARPEHVVDHAAGREYVTFAYNADRGGDTSDRVVVGTRCAVPGARWEFLHPREPADPGIDQYLPMGTPALVLDRAHDMVHLAFVEGQRDGAHVDLDADGDIYWLRADVSSLPACP